MRSTSRDWLVYRGKWAVAYVLWALGVLTLWRWFTLRRRVVVLAYHRVLRDDVVTGSHPGIVVTPETFERQMRLLQKTFRIISLAEFESRVRSRTPFEPNSCLITFDDGWIDTYTSAWPVLRKLSIPAVVFLPTSFIGSSKTFWQEHLGILLCEAAAALRDDPSFASRLTTALSSCNLTDFLPLAARGDRAGIIIKIRDLKTDASFEPAAAVRRLAELFGDRVFHNDTDRFMNWDQAREMSSEGIAFGSHGHTHRLMTNLRAEELATELASSRSFVERELGVPVTSMSYPNGNWNASVARQVKAECFAIGFSMKRGHFATDDEAYSIPRMNVHEGVSQSMPFFLARILGVL